MGMSLETMANWITNYVRIQKNDKRDVGQIHRNLQKGLRVEHPEKIMGYAGFFFDLGDVYASGFIAEQMDFEEFRSFVFDSLKRFNKGDYGQISQNDNDENVENRCLFGINRLFGRYGFYFPDCRRKNSDPYDEVICIRKLEENTWVTEDSEADWFLFLEDEHLKLIKDKNWL